MRPYTYLIGWSKLNKWYYGRRTANGCNPAELWKTYFTSSKVVRQFRQQYGEPDVIQIRRKFSDIKICCMWESTVLRRLDAQQNSKFLNKKNGDEKWDVTGIFLGKAPAKDLLGKNLGFISVLDPKWKSGEIISANKGTTLGKKRLGTCAKDSKTGKLIGYVLKTDPRWSDGSIIHNRVGVSFVVESNKTNAVAKDPVTGIILGRVSLDDTRWKTKEIVGVNYGRPGNRDYVPSAEVDEKIRTLKMGTTASADTKRKMSEDRKGRLYFNNGIVERRLNPSKHEIPPNFVRGKLPLAVTRNT